MNDQNFKNHRRFLPLWHITLPLLMLIILGFSIINFLHSDMDAENVHIYLPIILIPVVMVFHWAYTRRFALVAQDRAIRAEESLRHFILTGKPIDRKLSLVQIIALRFASDEELPALSKKTVEENLTPKDIKKSIQHWRADHHRV
jgi:hypothetical protein